MHFREWSVVRRPLSVVRPDRHPGPCDRNRRSEQRKSASGCDHGRPRQSAADHGPRTTDQPRGFTLIELTVTLILLGVMAGTLVPLLGHATRVQRETDRRQVALYEAHNLLERLSNRPWDELTADAAQNETLLPDVRDALPGARLNVTIAEIDGDDGAKRITVELAWTLRDGVEAAPVRLVAWRYRLDSQRRAAEEASDQ